MGLRIQVGRHPSPALGGRGPPSCNQRGRDTTSLPHSRSSGSSPRRWVQTQSSSMGSWSCSTRDGRPSFSRLQHRIHTTSAKDAKRAARLDPVSMVIFDLLHLNGRSLIGSPYDDRRAQLEHLELAGASWAVTPSFTDEPGADVLRSRRAGHGRRRGQAARQQVPPRGSRSRDWIKVKSQRTQEVVIGGWTEGQGDRREPFGALLLGLPAGGARRQADLCRQSGYRLHPRCPRATAGQAQAH